jgi:metallo-beta-lactamase family protein
MKLHFLGANRQVTGSRYCLEVGDDRVMIDCGMFQERPYLDRNWDECPLPASEFKALVLTHAHVDHCGLIPKFVREGYRRPILCTRPTVDLTEVILRDSARIQGEDVKYKKKRHSKEGRKGKHPEVPLFTEADVEKTIPKLQGVPYGKKQPVTDSIDVTFHDAGHILGSAMLQFHVREKGREQTVLFSGDIGQWGKPLIRDPSLFTQADYVVMESTYGDREHVDGGSIEHQLEKVINETVGRGGNVVIPTFAVERSQELMYYISRLVHADRIADIPVFLDSPMAIDVTEIFRLFRDCFDESTWQLITSNEPPLRFPGLRMVRSSQDSREINKLRSPHIVMATSGMCTAGRIKHHLRHNIGDARSTILFVGYQAHGTLGRQIVEGSPIVRIHGREWKVKAQVRRIDGFSGHADRSDLLRWIGNLNDAPKEIFLVHGEEEAARSFAQLVAEQLKWKASVPAYRETVELLS